ncbi:Ketosteroid isomerase homolog [Granulicella rosea]|uniref:Ketosteroid isomerase homolog n=1 Tax=Granulicella rosea TaxID=474952 RepID=A0A239JTX9_9BACT|nr:nuclear transport factor 2 family protein [Granulicella rosea]SNT08334.1 Ketosteroid isomerase homolog [Granulicella rosea]
MEDHASAKAEIEALMTRRCELLVKGDLVASMQMCAEEYELVLGDAPTLIGREAVMEMYRSIYAEAVFGLSFKIEDLRVCGTLAVVFMREWMTLQPHRGTEIEHFALRRLNVLECRNGTWLFVRAMAHLQPLVEL